MKMQQLSNNIIDKSKKIYHITQQYTSWVMLVSYQKIRQLITQDKIDVMQEKYSLTKQFVMENKYACLGASMLVGYVVYRCLRKSKGNNSANLNNNNTNDNNKSKRSNKNTSTDKNKKVFASEDQIHKLHNNNTNQIFQQQQQDQLQQQYYQSDKYQTTFETKKNLSSSRRRKHSNKNNNLNSNSDDFQMILQKQLEKMSFKKVILEDSQSDKIFNQMYGMYKDAFNQEQ